MRGRALIGVLALVACGPASRSHDLASSEQAIRPDSAASQSPRYDSSENVESVVSPGGLYRIHFTRSGPNAVPAADTDSNGTPDFVDMVAATYDRVLALYGQMGFRRPPDDTNVLSGNGGDGLFDVYLLDFGGHADGAYREETCFTPELGCAGYMVQENDFAGYGYPSIEQAIEILASHEMFHGVQAAYNPAEGSIVSEGTAVWATEHFNPALADFEGFVSGYLSRPDKTLTVDPVGPVQDFSYGSALFFEFLSEKHGDEIIRKLWEDCVPGAHGIESPQWLPALDALLKRDYQSSFNDAFLEFTRWNLFTGGRADPTRGYAHGSAYDPVAIEAKAFPADITSRLALASSRYFQASLEGRGHLVAEWISTDGESSDVTVSLATLKRLKVVSVTSGAGRVEAEANDADGVIFFATNPALDGASQTGFLCAGTSEEVESCKATHTGTSSDGGTPEPTTPKKKGCATVDPSALALLGIALRRLVRRGTAR